ncbi:hypothetical protein B5X24_HaOG209052 [Helicoverpa armigera]|uniref:Uncharacterized protein n=1 Tax=Helicoverpa armigera TaxID=29058 RepID=A0A2W1BK10_HELAM|nr:hypothetical protein B5X24_HaOG209052 [Helicoverpa armigera]
MDNLRGKPLEATTMDFDTESLLSLGTGVKYEDPKFHLNLVQRKELPSERPLINSTKCQRLSYFRAVTSSQSKCEIVATQHSNINSFLWFYSFNVFFKSLPHYFVHFFLAAYAPEEHLFIVKMVPICFGMKFLFAIVGFLEVLFLTDLTVVMGFYTFYGLVAKNPWNRCQKGRVYFDPMYNLTVHCYELKEFSTLFINKTHYQYEMFYVHQDTGEYFQVSQLEYYRDLVTYITSTWNISIFVLSWLAVHLLPLLAWKASYWKILHYCQWGVNYVDIVLFVYLLYMHYATGYHSEINPPIPFDKPGAEIKYGVTRLSVEAEQSLWAGDLEMLAESMTAPSVIHILVSRSSQEIDPAADSSVMMISNALTYIFRALLVSRVKQHCEELVHTTMPFSGFNEHSWFYYWPMLWTDFILGDIFSVFYMNFNMFTEMFMIGVTNLCVMETINYEWPRVKKWMIATVSYTGSMWKAMSAAPVGQLNNHYVWSWGLMVLPIILGVFYMIYKYLVIHRTTWNYIFRPIPKWGPRDFSVRQLRKQFDSRYYIGSEVPRLLSRYLLSKRETKVFKVDVRYDVQRRSTVSKAVGFGAYKDAKSKMN